MLTVGRVLAETVPLSRLMEQIEGLRRWAQGRARFATSRAEVKTGRKISRLPASTFLRYLVLVCFIRSNTDWQPSAPSVDSNVVWRQHDVEPGSLQGGPAGSESSR